MIVTRALLPKNVPSAFQRSVRHRAGGLCLHKAVQVAVNLLFQFTHRAEHASALWCAREHVWLGSRTFVNWAMCDAGIDIPWVVAKASDAPRSSGAFDKAVRVELESYWEEHLTTLPP